MNFINSLSNPVACVSIHSQGEIIYWNCGQSAAGKTAAKKLANSIKEYNGYSLINTDSFTSASADWCMLVKGIPSVTVETGIGNCPLPYSSYAGIYEDIRDILLIVARKDF